MSQLAPLGRLVSKDGRDKRFLLQRKSAVGIESRHWYMPSALDQGNTSSCVGHAWAHWLMAGPTTNKLPFTAFEIYHRAQKVDEWPGESYDGTSVRGGAKVLQTEGRVSSYSWAFDAETVVNHVLTTGPMVLGTSWYRSMFTPHDKTGVMEISGPNDGGHAYLIAGVSRKTGLARILNSWGLGWAQKGRAWLRLSDLERLILEDGEACVAVEVKK
jgi:hypothetical protein